MLVRCNKRHLCSKLDIICSHYDWHKYNDNCNDLCVIHNTDANADCIEINQPDFISEEDMEIC